MGASGHAVRLARQRARIAASERVELVVYPQKRSFYDLVSSQFGSPASMP